MKKEEVFPKFMKFNTKDPFNPGNRLEGILSYDRDNTYRSLHIKKVNGEKVEQPIIYTTPKLMYPFDKGGNFHFPSAHKILCFKKYDGTNIFMYKYRNSKNKEFITYKTRTWPVIGPHFYSMWSKMLKKYPIYQLFGLNPELNGFSFELYGQLNPHLVNYKTELDTVILFGRDKNNNVIPCSEIETGDVPKAELTDIVTKDYVWNYTEQQRELGNILEDSTIINPQTLDYMFEGEEGRIWYLLKKQTNTWLMLKCKPKEIEKIHMDALKVNTIDRNTITATILNACEVYDLPDLDIILEYLAEEFSSRQINRSMKRIKSCLRHQKRYLKINKKVNNLINKCIIDLDLNIKDILRTINTHFEKDDIGKVFQVLDKKQKINRL